MRVAVAGVIKVPKGDDAEGVTIYNNTSQKGTTSAADGTFTIEVAENDRLLVAAIQFQSFTVIIDNGVVDSKKLSVNLFTAINTLAEIIVRPYDLSGNVRADVGKIKVTNLEVGLKLDYKTVEYKMGFTDDAFSKIRGNAAQEALNDHTLVNGVNFVAIFAGLANVIFPKKTKSKEEQIEESIYYAANLKQRFSKPYIVSTFNIEEDKASDFLYFVEENGIPKNLLKLENEMELLQLLLKRSTEYKALSEKE